MWESFIEFLERLIREYGLIKIVIGMAAVAGALLGLGVVVSEEMLIVFAGASLIALLLVICVALMVDRHRLRRDLAEDAEVLDRYGQEIVSRQNSQSFTIKDWREEQYIEKHGDTTFSRRITLIVGNQPLQTFWHKVHMTTGRQDYGYRKKFRIEARTFDGDELGVRFPITRTWEGHSISVFIHLDRSYGPGEEVPVYLQIYWPEYTKDLVEGNLVDPTEWEFHRKCENIEVTMSFAKRLRIRRDFHISPFPGTPRPNQSRGPDKRRRIEFAYPNPPQKTPIGFRLERAS
jgi:hypothetical protein